MMQCLSFGHKSAEHLCNWFYDCRTFRLTSVVYYHLIQSPPNGQNKDTVFLQDDFCDWVSWVCLLSKLWFVFLTMAITVLPTAVQGSLLSHSLIHFTDNMQNFGSSVVRIVGHDSSWKTQENTKICTSLPPHLEHGKRLHFFFLSVVIYIYIIYNQIYSFNSFKSKYHVALPTPLSNFRTFSSPLTESLDSLNANFPFFPPQDSWQPLFHFLSTCIWLLQAPHKWNHTRFVLLYLASFT